MDRRTFALGAALSLVLLWTKSAVTAPADPAVHLLANLRPVMRYQLDNGLDVLLQEDPSAPSVTVNVWYHVGSADEPKGRSGLAHLCEHLMFRGSKHVQASHQGVLSEVGAIHHNGSTTFHQTSYFETVPRVNLPTALWLESDRMGFLLDALDEQKLRAEREIVKNERRQLFDAAPYGLAEERLWHALFPLPHPYHGLVIGSMEDLDRVTLRDVRTFFARYYVPHNATLAVVGDFDAASARSLIDKYFGSLRSSRKSEGPDQPRPQVELPRATMDKEILIRHEEQVGTAPKILIGWHSPALYEEGDTAAAVLAATLSASRASRLQRRLSGLASAITASQESLRGQSIFKIAAVARPRPGKGTSTIDLGGIVREIDTVLEEIQAGGLTEEEVRRARLRLRTGNVIEMQEIEKKARRLLAKNRDQAEGPGATVLDGLSRYERVTAAEVTELARKVLRKERRVVVYAVPTAAQSLLWSEWPMARSPWQKNP